MNYPKLKKLLLRLGLGAGVILASGLAIAYFCANSIVKSRIETEGSAMTETAVRAGAVNVAPFSGAGFLADLSVGNPPGYQTSPGVTVRRISFTAKISTLLSEPKVIEEFRIEEPEFRVEGTLLRNNLSQILENMMKMRSRRKFIVRDLLITGAVVKFNLTGSFGAGMPPSMTLPPLHLKDLGAAANGERPSQIAAEVAMPLMASIAEIALKASPQNSGNTNAPTGSELLRSAVRGLGGLFGR